MSFQVLGLGIAADGFRSDRHSALPFIAFGFFMALAGLFGQKLIAPAAPCSECSHRAHSVLASLTGVAITVALAWRARCAITRNVRTLALSLAVLCLALPLSMLGFAAYQGLIQRFMYLLIFIWLWRYSSGKVTS